MSAPQFTPGPWTLTQHAKFGDTQMYWVNEATSVGTQVEADVRLIAAAPELYEALERIAENARQIMDDPEQTASSRRTWGICREDALNTLAKAVQS